MPQSGSFPESRLRRWIQLAYVPSPDLCWPHLPWTCSCRAAERAPWGGRVGELYALAEGALRKFHRQCVGLKCLAGSTQIQRKWGKYLRGKLSRAFTGLMGCQRHKPSTLRTVGVAGRLGSIQTQVPPLNRPCDHGHSTNSPWAPFPQPSEWAS